MAAITAADSSIPTSATGRVIAIRPASGTAVTPARTASQESSASSTPGSAATLFNPATAVAGDVCSPGGLASLSGEGFTSQGAQAATSLPLPTTLGNVQVKVNGEAAPLLFASASQVNFQCPQLAPGSPLDVTLIAESGAAIPAASSTMAAAAPGLFTVDATNQGVILIASANQIAMPETKGMPSRLAKPGENLAIYADGLGEVMNGVRRRDDGHGQPDPDAQPGSYLRWGRTNRASVYRISPGNSWGVRDRRAASAKRPGWVCGSAAHPSDLT